MTLFELFHEGPYEMNLFLFIFLNGKNNTTVLMIRMPHGAYLSLLRDAKPNFDLLQRELIKNPIVPYTAKVKSSSVGGL